MFPILRHYNKIFFFLGENIVCLRLLHSTIYIYISEKSIQIKELKKNTVTVSLLGVCVCVCGVRSALEVKSGVL